MNDTVKTALLVERAKLSAKVQVQERCVAAAQKRLDAANAKLRILRPRLADIETHLAEGGVKLGAPPTS